MIDPTIVAPAVYTPSTQSIIFKSQDDINEYNMQEEMFHRYQDAYYANGINQYNPNGIYDIEFEAAFLRDVSNMVNGFGGQNAVSTNDYDVWLFSITENGTKFPTQWSHISDQYYYFLGKYKSEYPGLGNGAGTAINLEPQAFLTVTRSSACKKRL